MTKAPATTTVLGIILAGLVATAAGKIAYDQNRDLASFRVSVPVAQGETATAEFQLPPGDYIVKAIPWNSYQGVLEAHQIEYELTVPSKGLHLKSLVDLSFPNKIKEHHIERFSFGGSAADVTVNLKLQSYHREHVQITIEVIEAVLFRTVE